LLISSCKKEGLIVKWFIGIDDNE